MKFKPYPGPQARFMAEKPRALWSAKTGAYLQLASEKPKASKKRGLK